MRARRYLRVIGIFVVSFLITFNALSYHASEEDLHDREEVARESPCLPCAVFEARSSLAPARAVDVVYTWVNGSDPAFRDALARRKAEWELVDAEKRGDGHGNGESGAKSSDENELGAKRRDVAANLTASNLTKNRFDDHDELRYSLRSVWMHAPWIRNVIVVTNGQIPSWLNLTHPKVRVVTHAEIFPNAEHLPTFSSHAIEMHLHTIPGISKTFLYMNDDFFLGADVGYDDFYTEAKGTKVHLSWIAPPCDYACKNEIRAGKWAEPRPASSFEMDVFGQTLAYANYLLDDAFGEAPLERKVPAHAPHLVDVEIMQEVVNKWREEHERTSSHYFRHPMDLQYQSVYLYYLMNAKRGRTSFEFASAFDADGDGELSKRELRHLDAVMTHIFSSSLNMSFGLDSDQGGRGRDEPLPVRVESLLRDETVAAKIDEIVAKEKKYEYEILDADSDGARLNHDTHPRPHIRPLCLHESVEHSRRFPTNADVRFYMIRDAKSAIMNDLEKIRGAPPKFMCLNDDLDVALPPDERARMLTEVRELLETLYPYRSPFELPLEEED
jgi:UDP-N-acetylglucosamine-lysosomal-enzyme